MNKVFSKFVKQMEYELEANSHKGDWSKFKDQNKIMEELYYHIDKFEAIRLTTMDIQLMQEYCADIANIAMFMFNSLEETERPCKHIWEDAPYYVITNQYSEECPLSGEMIEYTDGYTCYDKICKLCGETEENGNKSS